MNLTEMRARVREDLKDTDAQNYIWTDDEVDGAIDRVVMEYSAHAPIQQQSDIPTTDGDTHANQPTHTTSGDARKRRRFGFARSGEEPGRASQLERLSSFHRQAQPEAWQARRQVQPPHRGPVGVCLSSGDFDPVEFR